MSLKNDILELLINQKEALSGEEIAKKFNVSRAAIWKCIQSLNDEGYKIEGKSNCGYILNENIDIYSKEYLTYYLNQPFHIEIFNEINSTSTYLKKIVNEGNENCLVCAYKQSNGRGRTGKSFFSPENGLYFSFSFKPKEKQDLTLITIKVGLAVIHAIKKLFNLDCEIKWVNDVYYLQKKVCGILCEALIDFESKDINAIMIGIGINLYMPQIPDELKDVAISLNVKNANKNLLIATIMNEVLSSSISNLKMINEYKEKCILMNREITFTINNISYNGIVKDINNEGNLVVLVDNHLMYLKSGEVSLGSKKYEKKNH